MHDNTIQPEKAIAVAVERKGADRDLAFEHLKELESLAKTAGAEIVEKVYQELDRPNPKTVLGKGKIEELKLMLLEEDYSMIIFDDDLSPAQVKNLENTLQVKVLDRSGLILDIFAQHARSLEAKLQVELAQSQYLLPRLTRMWTHLSKQYGGVGTKGPGETQIETDRRMLKIRIQLLKEKISEISVQKEQQRKGRASLTRYALVGYTNAGKSTLMNMLTEAGVYVENKLFATLDTTVRSFELPSGQKALISDTVGFIRKLPTHLVASFRSTLAEAAEADVLVHVVDVSHPFFRMHIKAVEETLASLNIKDRPTLLVLNKIDLIAEKEMLGDLSQEFPDSIFLSAKRGINIAALMDLFQKKFDEAGHFEKLMIPYSHSALVAKLYAMGEIVSREDTDHGTKLEIKLQPEKMAIFNSQFSEFRMK